MGHGKETPRQKMIGMMYLVLTALLALNVQKEVLNAFVIVDEGITKMNENYQEKNSKLYDAFELALLEKPEKTRKWRDIALKVKAMANNVYNTIQDKKIEIVYLAESKETPAVKGREIIPMEITSKDNADKPAEIMIVKGGGKQLRSAIEEFRKFMIDNIDPKAEGVRNSIMLSLNTKDPEMKDGNTESWETEHFEHLPLVGVTTIMTGLQSNIRNAESDMLRYLYSMIDKGTFKFTTLEGTVIQNSNYIIQGNEYQAKVFLAAFDTSQNPTIFIGPYDSTLAEGGYTYSLKKGMRYDSIPVKNGKGTFSQRGAGVGFKRWGGLIKLKAPDGAPDVYKPFKAEYQVAEPMLVVAPTKMNVFYIGVDNPVEISVPSVGADKVFPTISNGTISKEGNGYIVRVTRAGEVEVNVKAKIERTERNMGSKKFRVKTVPDPIAKVAGIKISGGIDRNVFLAQAGVVAEMENFDFELTYKVTEFKVSTLVNGFINDKTSKSNRFTTEQFDLVKRASKGQKVYIEDIKAIGPDGTTRQLGSISLTIK